MSANDCWQPYPEYKELSVNWPGEIPTHWETKRVKRVFDVINGSTPRSSEPAYWDGSIPWATPNDLGKLAGDTILETERLITREGYESCGTKLVPAGSLVLSTRAPIGHLAIAGMNLCTNQGCRALTFCSEEDVHFFYYQLLAARPNLESLGRGSTFLELGRDEIESVLLAYPPLPEQRAIAAFLDHKTAHIDALIAKKERQIELFQEKRASLISHAVTKGLDPSVPMKDSGIEWLGEIPAHWEIEHLRRVVAKFVDYRGHTPEKVESGVPLITARNIKNGHIDFSLSTEYMREDEYEDWMVRGWPKIGDVLITTEAPLGGTAQVTDTRIALAQRIILLKVNISRMINEYLKYHFLSAFGQGELWSRATGSTAIGIRADRFKDSLVAVPPLEEQEEIVHLLNNKITVLERPLQKIEQSIERLREYRTALISAAVTGKIDVRDEEDAAKVQRTF